MVRQKKENLFILTKAVELTITVYKMKYQWIASHLLMISNAEFDVPNRHK